MIFIWEYYVLINYLGLLIDNFSLKWIILPHCLQLFFFVLSRIKEIEIIT